VLHASAAVAQGRARDVLESLAREEETQAAESAKQLAELRT